jgi:hypothetical protein
LLERDKFCRLCGVRQALQAEATTKLLPPSFSGALVKVVAQCVSQQASALPSHHLARRLLTLAVVLPLWLLIVLLSPLDAYRAARAATNSCFLERGA